MTKVYKESAPSFSTVKNWAAKFKSGVDHPREGLPKTK